jgi:putative phage-type endonuclease
MPLTPEQLLKRRDKIGGSDAAAICGKDPHKTAYAVALRILGQIQSDELEGLDFIEFGNEMEGVLARFYERKEKVKLYTPEMLVHPEHDFLAVNIDRIREDRMEIGIECKNTGLFGAEQWGEPGTDEVPERVLLQCQHAMLVKSVFTEFHVLRCYGGNTYQKFFVHRSEKLIAALLEIELDFMSDLRRGVLPEPEWNHRTTKDTIKKAFTNIEGEIVEASEPLLLYTADWHIAAATRLAAEKTEKALKNRIEHALGNAAGARLPDGRIWRRKQIERDGYTVEPSSYIECRLVKG